MRLVISVEKSQLQGVLEELGGSFPDMDIVINIKEEESKQKVPDLTTENLQQRNFSLN
ncbi:hypothetical protein ES703_75700 [subsurface metagenome]